jgi:hypothetical protein
LQLACRGGGRGDFLVSIPMVVVLSLELVLTLEADMPRVLVDVLVLWCAVGGNAVMSVVGGCGICYTQALHVYIWYM